MQAYVVSFIMLPSTVSIQYYMLVHDVMHEFEGASQSAAAIGLGLKSKRAKAEEKRKQ